jgi:hypothetical protein
MSATVLLHAATSAERLSEVPDRPSPTAIRAMRDGYPLEPAASPCVCAAVSSQVTPPHWDRAIRPQPNDWAALLPHVVARYPDTVQRLATI